MQRKCWSHSLRSYFGAVHDPDRVLLGYPPLAVDIIFIFGGASASRFAVSSKCFRMD